MIELQNVSFKFNEQVQVLNQASYSFQDGYLYAFSGSTEAARNTTFSLMCGLIEPEVGRVIFNGTNIKQLTSEELLRKEIGLIDMQNKYVDYLSVNQNILLAMDISVPDKKNKKELIYDYLMKTGLTEENFKKKIIDLNHTQRFLVDIAIVTLCDKKVIFINGPIKSFNDTDRLFVVGQIKKLAHEMGKCVILSTDSKVIARLADKIVVLKNGKLI